MKNKIIAVFLFSIIISSILIFNVSAEESLPQDFDLNLYHNDDDIVIHNCDSLDNITNTVNSNVSLTNIRVEGNNSINYVTNIANNDLSLYFKFNNLNISYDDINDYNIGMFIYFYDLNIDFDIRLFNVDSSKYIRWYIDEEYITNNFNIGWNYITLNFINKSTNNPLGYTTTNIIFDNIDSETFNSLVFYTKCDTTANILFDDLRVSKNSPQSTSILQGFNYIGGFLWRTVNDIVTTITANPILIIGTALLCIGGAVGLLRRLKNG